MAFNKNLDRDIEPEPDILHHTKHPPAAAALTHEGAGPGLHKVYSLDQLNQVSFEVGLEMDSNIHREIFIELVLSFLHFFIDCAKKFSMYDFSCCRCRYCILYV